MKPITICWPSSTSCYKSPRVFTYLSGKPGSWGPGLWTPRGREFPAPEAALGFTTGNLQVEAPGMPLPDSGECVWQNLTAVETRWKAMILGERGSCLGRVVTFLFPVIYCAYKWVENSSPLSSPSSPQRKTQLYSSKLPNQLLIFGFGCSTLFHHHLSLFCVECNKINVIHSFFFPFSTLSFESLYIFRKTTE